MFGAVQSSDCLIAMLLFLYVEFSYRPRNSRNAQGSMFCFNQDSCNTRCAKDACG